MPVRKNTAHRPSQAHSEFVTTKFHLIRSMYEEVSPDDNAPRAATTEASIDRRARHRGEGPRLEGG